MKKKDNIPCAVTNDPGGIYKNPDAVLADNRLSYDEKKDILHGWEQDQLALLRADDESMNACDNSTPAIDLLGDIKEAEKKLTAGATSIKSAFRKNIA